MFNIKFLFVTPCRGYRISRMRCCSVLLNISSADNEFRYKSATIVNIFGEFKVNTEGLIVLGYEDVRMAILMVIYD